MLKVEILYATNLFLMGIIVPPLGKKSVRR